MHEDQLRLLLMPFPCEVTPAGLLTTPKYGTCFPITLFRLLVGERMTSRENSIGAFAILGGTSGIEVFCVIMMRLHVANKVMLLVVSLLSASTGVSWDTFGT